MYGSVIRARSERINGPAMSVRRIVSQGTRDQGLIPVVRYFASLSLSLLPQGFFFFYHG